MKQRTEPALTDIRADRVDNTTQKDTKKYLTKPNIVILSNNQNFMIITKFKLQYTLRTKNNLFHSHEFLVVVC